MLNSTRDSQNHHAKWPEGADIHIRPLRVQRAEIAYANRLPSGGDHHHLCRFLNTLYHPHPAPEAPPTPPKPKNPPAMCMPQERHPGRLETQYPTPYVAPMLPPKYDPMLWYPRPISAAPLRRLLAVPQYDFLFFHPRLATPQPFLAQPQRQVVALTVARQALLQRCCLFSRFPLRKFLWWLWPNRSSGPRTVEEPECHPFRVADAWMAWPRPLSFYCEWPFE